MALHPLRHVKTLDTCPGSTSSSSRRSGDPVGRIPPDQVRIHVRQLIAVQRLREGLVVEVGFLGSAVVGLLHELGQILLVEGLGVVVGLDRGGRLIRAELNAVVEVGNGHLIIGQQSRSPYPGAVDPGAVGAAEVAEQQQAVGALR